jgi:Zn-dependent protease
MSVNRTSVPLVPGSPGPVLAGPQRRLPRANVGLLAVAVKLAKSTKLLLILASVAAYCLVMSWQASAFLVACLCCHEYGHVWAMRRRGIPTSGFYLIPLVGGFCAASRPSTKRSDEAFIAAMGPVAGLAAAVQGYAIIGLLTGNPPALARAAEIVVFVNLFNLVPIVPMDGGRMLRACVSSFSRPVGLVLVFAGVAAAVLIAVDFHAWILVWVAVLAVFEIRAERRRSMDIAPLGTWSAIGWIGIYLVIALGAVHLLGAYGAVAGGPGLSNALRRF